MNKGFTLIELIVVATIISLLAAVGAVSYSVFSKNARDSRRVADLEQIRAAVELYRSNNNVYPASITFGGNLCDPAGCPPSGNLYLQKITNDPRPPYTYFYTGSAGDYTLGAYLEAGGTGSTCGACGTGITCNYCLGPYGQK